MEESAIRFETGCFLPGRIRIATLNKWGLVVKYQLSCLAQTMDLEKIHWFSDDSPV